MTIFVVLYEMVRKGPTFWKPNYKVSGHFWNGGVNTQTFDKSTKVVTSSWIVEEKYLPSLEMPGNLHRYLIVEK